MSINKFDYTGARMLDSIYHMTFILLYFEIAISTWKSKDFVIIYVYYMDGIT